MLRRSGMVRDLWYVAVTGDDGTAKRDNSYWLKGPKNVVSGDSRDPSLRSG
jgi:hypothetical protein